MKQLLFAVPIALAASSGAAQDVLFRSGEHEDFTRLVATLPSSETEWSISRDGRYYTIKIEGDAVNLRTSSIFDRIPRDRLANFVATDSRGELELELACDCRVVSIPYDERYVIFDIREGQPLQQQDDLPQIPLSFGEAVREEQPQRKFRFSALEATKPAPVTLPERKPVEDYTDLIAFDRFVKRNTQVSVLKDDLVAQVDRAANQNLLTAQINKPASNLVSNPVKTEAPVVAGASSDHVPPQASVGLEGQDLNIVAYNVIDEVGRDIAALLSGKVSTGSCMPDGAVSIADWSGEQTFVQELARIRQDLVGEFDRTNEEALKELAQLYVHYTFGAEALQVLKLLPETGDNKILAAMAHVVDGDIPEDAEHAFANQGHCAGNSALWAALSGEQLIGESAINGALDALHAMPRHLREYLGPRLSNRLVAQGETEAATLVLNAVERTHTKSDASFEYAQATLNAEIGDTEAATETLTDLAKQNNDVATTAVVELIDSHVKQGMPATADTVSLVGALAVEHKAGAMGPKLRRAHALARMLEQNFVSAFDIIDDIETRDGMVAATKVRSQVVDAMIDQADEFDLIALSIEQRLAEPGRVSADTAMKLAQKTFDLGFVGQTKRLLQAAQTGAPSDAKRLLKARVALADGLPSRAEAELIGVETEEAQRLRALALAEAGDHAGAAALLTELGAHQEAELETWLGGQLEALAQSENEVYRKTSSLLAPAENTAEGDAAEQVIRGILAENRLLLEGSQESRSVLDELLDWHSLSDPSS